jgi:hypothetical protein
MRAMIAFLVACVLVCSTSGRDFVPSQTAPDGEPIAVASIHVDKRRFKSGEDIQLTILLAAGTDGVYIPKGWGLAGGGIPGFFVYLTTLSGKGAETCGSSADALPTHEPDPIVALNTDFIYLPAQSIVGVKTTISCPTKRPGQYRINAFYSPYHADSERIAQLPATHGLVLREGVQAKPVTISIY